MTAAAPAPPSAPPDHLSYSQISSYLRCPKQWAADKLYGRRGKAGSALVKGSVVDKVSTANWRLVMNGDPGIQPEDAGQVVEDAFVDHVNNAMGGRDEVDWSTESYPRAMESAVTLTQLHLRDHAPLITPKAVQARISKPIPGTKRSLLGFIDAVADDGWLVDVKTGSRRMPEGDAHTDMQATAYAWLVGEPLRFSFFRVIDTGKSSYSEVVHTTRSRSAIEQFSETAYAVSTLIDTGYYPANPGWQCRWCPLKTECVDALT